MGVTSTKKLLGDLRTEPLGKPSECPECGAKSQVLTSPLGYLYHRLKCPCIERQTRLSAQRSYEQNLQVFYSATRTIVHWRSMPERERDNAALGVAVAQARAAVGSLREYAYAFGFDLPREVADWKYHA